jgi:small GTP-binding protein
VYVDFYRPPSLARNEFLRFGEYAEDRLVLVDALSAQLLVESREKHAIRDIESLESIADTIIEAIQGEHPTRVVIDSMEFLADRFPKDRVLAQWRRIIEASRVAGSVGCFLFLNWTYQERDIAAIRAMSDYVIEFQSSMRGGIVRNSMRITQTGDGGVMTNWIPYTFKDLVGVTVYFPRILVTGPFNAGKSTVVQALSERAFSIDRMGTTVAFDYGNVNLSGIEAELLGTPGQERFEFIFKIFAHEVSGVLLVVDATRPMDFPRAKYMLDLIGPRLPYVVLGNKSDLPGALSADQIMRKMDLPEDTIVVPTVATDGKGLRDALLILAEMIIGVR